MRRGITVVVSALALLSSPAFAEDEIEMEPDPVPETKKDPPKVEPKKDEPKPVAEPVAKDPKLALKLVYAARISVQRGDYYARIKKVEEAKKEHEAALAALQKAVELGDDPNIYFDLASVEDKLGKTADAAIHWRVVIKATAGVRPDVLKKATAKYEDAITKLGLLTLVVKPEGTTITLANAELGKSPLPQPLILLPGTYAFSFSAEGHQLKELEIKVQAGSETERGVDLEPIKIIVEPKAVVVVEPPPPPPVKTPSKLPLYVGAGATGGLLVGGVIVGSLALGKQRTFSGVDTASSDREDARSSGRSLARVADVMFVGTLLAGGFTAYWWYFKYRPAQRKLKEGPAPTPTRSGDDPLSAKVLVAPWVQGGAGGVSFGGRF